MNMPARTDISTPLLEDTYVSNRDTIANRVKSITIGTLSGSNMGIGSTIAYLDEGSAHYEKFMDDVRDGEGSNTSKLLTIHKQALASTMGDIDRLVIIGGGSYQSMMSQEMLVLSEIIGSEKRKKQFEVVLVDVSESFLAGQKTAVQDIASKNGSHIKISSIQSAFGDAADCFDEIMTNHFGSEPKDKIKSALMMTGGTFGNIEDIPNYQTQFPHTRVEEQMARLSAFVGIGDCVMVDYFTGMDSDASYYNNPHLADFFNNIPKTMVKRCPNLHGLLTNPLGDNESFFRYAPRLFRDSRLISHALIAEQEQQAKIVNGTTRDLSIRKGQVFPMMFSLRPFVSDIEQTSPHNTGLKSTSYMADGGVVVHTFKKVGLPSLFQPN